MYIATYLALSHTDISECKLRIFYNYYKRKELPSKNVFNVYWCFLPYVTFELWHTSNFILAIWSSIIYLFYISHISFDNHGINWYIFHLNILRVNGFQIEPIMNIHQTYCHMFFNFERNLMKVKFYLWVCVFQNYDKEKAYIASQGLWKIICKLIKKI